MKRTIGQTAILLVLVFLCSCSPNLKSTLEVPFIPVKGVEGGSAIPEERAQVALDELRDSRSAASLAVMGPDSSEPASDVRAPVRSALESALRHKGFGLTDSAPIVLGVEIKKWVAEIRGGVPAELSAEAAIGVQVFDPANKKIYTGNYQGSLVLREGKIDDQDIRSALGSAMSEAIEQLTSDRKLAQLLSSF